MTNDVNLKEYFTHLSEVEFMEVLVEYTDGTSETLNLILDANGD